MITTDTPYVRGGILSLSPAEENEPPGFVTFLSQGVAAGALFMFQFLIGGLLTESAYYGLLFIGAVPRYLGIGAVFGGIQAIIIWACTYVAGRRIHVALRLAIAIVILVVLRVLIYFIYYEPPPSDPQSQTRFFIYNGLFFLGGSLLFGLLIGSRFKPLHELARGVSPARWIVINAITGFVLRIAVVLFLLYSIVIMIWVSRANTSRKEFVFAVITLSYFIAAVIILFVRMPFWLLLPLAVIVNFPVAAYVNDVIEPKDPALRTITLSYLVLWAAFLSCRVQLPPGRFFSHEKAHKAQNENNLKGDESE
jgi:hypothetical protein